MGRVASFASRALLAGVLLASACSFDLDAVPRPGGNGGSGGSGGTGGVGTGGTGGTGGIGGTGATAGTGGTGGATDGGPDAPPADGPRPDGPPPDGPPPLDGPPADGPSCPICLPSEFCLAGSCVSFAGAFGQNAAACSPACLPESTNAYTNTCTCPAGSTLSRLFQVMTDCTSPFQQTTITFCQSSALDPGSSWGGAYELDDQGTSPCRTPNSYANNTCACPASAPEFLKIPVVAATAGPSLITSQIIVCADTSVTDTFGGMYQTTDGLCMLGMIAAGGPGNCLPNPFTGACTCPIGYTSRHYRARTPCGTGATDGSDIYICTR